MINVLIVDDEFEQIKTAKVFLKRNFQDIAIDYTLDIKTGIEKVKEINPDIVICDVNFSAGSKDLDDQSTKYAGIELSESIKQFNPLIKIILNTGFGKDDTIRKRITKNRTYDEYFEKGDYDDFLSVFTKVYNHVETYKTGLIPKLCKFFAPTNYGWDIDKSIYRLLHSNFKREDNLQYIQAIIEYLETFSGQLTNKNRNLFSEFLQDYCKKQPDTEIVETIKEEFYFYPKNLDMLERGSELVLYSENSVINEIWIKIVSETKDHSKLDKCKFHEPVIEDYEIKFIIEQPDKFEFEKFINAGKTIRIYQKLKYYGNIIIFSETKKLDVQTEKIHNSGEDVKGTRIEMILKKIPTVKENGSKR